MKKLQFGDAFNSALFVFKQNWLILSAVILAMLVLVYGCLFAGISLVMGDASFFFTGMGQDPNAYASYLYGKVGGLVAVYLVVLILGFFLSLVVNKFMLDTFDNKRANFAESFNGSLRLFVPYLKTTLLFIPAYVVFLLFFWVVSVVVTMLFGFTLGHVSQALSAVVSYLVICVVILYVILRFSFVFLATLDGAGPSDSFRHSFRITKGNVLVLFLISFVCGVLGCVGMLCLFIGFFPAIAFGGLFMCSAYRHMSPKDGAELEEVEGKKNELGDQIM